MRIALVLLFLPCVLFSLAGCDDADVPDRASAIAPQSTVAASTAPVGRVAQDSNTPNRPLLLALLRDRSRSAAQTATPAVTPVHLSEFLALIAADGGELGYGEICDRSFVPLVRVRVEDPPSPPVRITTEDPFEQQRLDLVYRAQVEAYKRNATSQRSGSDRDITTFQALVEPMLVKPPTCGSSDVGGAVDRARLFLEEKHAGWSQPPRRVIALVSDAQHNTGPWKPDLPEDMELLLINGIGSRGIFDAANVSLFEGLAGAVRYLRQRQ